MYHMATANSMVLFGFKCWILGSVWGIFCTTWHSFLLWFIEYGRSYKIRNTRGRHRDTASKTRNAVIIWIPLGANKKISIATNFFLHFGFFKHPAKKTLAPAVTGHLSSGRKNWVVLFTSGKWPSSWKQIFVRVSRLNFTTNAQTIL